MQLVSGVFQADGAIIYLPVGYKPDYFELLDLNTSTNIVIYRFWGVMEDEMATGLKEGVSITEGVTARLADDGGFAAYGTGTESPTVTTWTTAVSTAATARTATAAGTYVKPSTSGVTEDGLTADRSAIFECVTEGTGGATEPAWPVGIGDQITDGSTVFERVNTPTFRKGYEGIRIAAALTTDSRYYFYNAFQADSVVVHGDVDSWTDGIDQDWR